MIIRTTAVTWTFVLMLAGTSGAAADPAGGRPDEERGARWEVWLGPIGWPALAELDPAAAGRFDDTGFALGGAFHVPIASSGGGELLAGVDLWVGGVDSSIAGLYDTLVARDFYLGPSLKYRPAFLRTFYLDAGIGLHLVDVADVSDYYLAGIEVRNWESSAVGAYVGATWDAGMMREGRHGGLYMSVEVHYVDLGQVYDEATGFGPLLGAAAGTLDGPLYLVQFGYAGR